MRLRTHFLTVLLTLPILAAGFASFAPLGDRLDSYMVRVEARDQVLAAKNILGAEIAKGSGRVDVARGLYEIRNDAWKAVMVAPDSIPAYPGAVGGGATALIACRGLDLKVYKVTNLSNSGTADGGLKAILDDSISSANFDVVVFDTAGSISGGGTFRQIDNKDCAYIAGQTAKGGIQLLPSHGIGGVMVGSSHPTGGSGNSVWRYIHVRCAILDTTPRRTNDCAGQDHRNEGAGDGDNIWDHISVSGGNDEMFEAAGNVASQRAVRLTVSYNLFFGAPEHHRGGAVSNVGDWEACDGQGTSFFRNVFSTTGWRHPNNGTGCLESINNYIYNWEQRNSALTDSTMTDWVRNLIDNSQTPPSLPNMIQSIVVWVDLTVDNITDCKPGGAAEANNCLGIFVEKNQWVSGGTVGSKTVLLDTLVDQWQTVCDNRNDDIPGDQECNHAGVDSTYFRRYSRLFGTSKFPLVEVQAADVSSLLFGTGTFSEDSISVGANGWIGCSGAGVEVGTGALTGVGFTRLIDHPDSLAIADIFNNTNRSYSNDLNDYLGGSPPVFTAAGPRCVDTDGDGMPNAWENDHSYVNSAVPDAANDLDEDGWLAIEEYINGSDPDVFTEANGTEGVPIPTFGNGRWVYEDTLGLYLLIKAGGADTDSVVQPDTSRYKTTAGSPPYLPSPKRTGTMQSGDTVLILVDDSLSGNRGQQLDSAQVDSLVNDWGQCASRGICLDSLRNRDIP